MRHCAPLQLQGRQQPMRRCGAGSARPASAPRPRPRQGDASSTELPPQLQLVILEHRWSTLIAFFRVCHIHHFFLQAVSIALWLHGRQA